MATQTFSKVKKVSLFLKENNLVFVANDKIWAFKQHLVVLEICIQHQ